MKKKSTRIRRSMGLLLALILLLGALTVFAAALEPNFAAVLRCEKP